MPAKIIWNDDLDNALRKLREEGVNRVDCAERMGISWPTLRARCRVLGIPTRLPRHGIKGEQRPVTKQVENLYREGHTPKEIARYTELSVSAVNSIIIRGKRAGRIPYRG